MKNRGNLSLLHHTQKCAANLDGDTVLSGFACNDRDTLSQSVKCSRKQFNLNANSATQCEWKQLSLLPPTVHLLWALYTSSLITMSNLHLLFSLLDYVTGINEQEQKHIVSSPSLCAPLITLMMTRVHKRSWAVLSARIRGTSRHPREHERFCSVGPHEGGGAQRVRLMTRGFKSEQVSDRFWLNQETFLTVWNLFVVTVWQSSGLKFDVI